MNKLFELSEDSKTSLIEDIEEYKSVVEKNLLQRLWLPLPSQLTHIKINVVRQNKIQKPTIQLRILLMHFLHLMVCIITGLVV